MTATDAAPASSNPRTPIDTGTEFLEGYKVGHVAVLAFNRPERRNALASEMYDGFAKVLPEIADDSDVRVLMITGNGGAFCAGGDVKAMNERNNDAQPGSGSDRTPPSIEAKVADLRARQRSVSLALRNLPQPVVAALPGPAAGAGLSIALAADLRVAAERAVLVTAFSGVGGSGDFGGSWFLTQLVGSAKAKEMYFMSPRMTATEAHGLGLVNQVFPDEGFDDAALDYCHALAGRAPIAIRYMKENIDRAQSVGLAEALDAEASAMVRAMSTADHREAAAAFVEKRNAIFHGS
ncbi:MAG: enoyl-CoA hydratase-related protein [Acidimicrobiales bacterium]